MRRIYTIGETVLDIIFKDSQPIAAKPGGAMLNTSVTLGRLGLPVFFISEYAKDQVGKTVENFLIDNKVNTELVYRYDSGKTSLAMAFLDKSNNASYDFYKIYPEKRLAIALPEINSNDILMFGSFYGITLEIRDSLFRFLNYARSKNVLIYYDPNFRKVHLHELDFLKPLIIQNMQMASIIRCSDEDMELIFGVNTPEKAYDSVKKYCANLIYTNSQKGVYLFTPTLQKQYNIKSIKPVSTIGAGDTFNAGIAYGLYMNNIKTNTIVDTTEDIWQNIICKAIDFATEVCLSYDNYLSVNYIQQLN